jgi:hypothetical protein
MSKKTVMIVLTGLLIFGLLCLGGSITGIGNASTQETKIGVFARPDTRLALDRSYQPPQPPNATMSPGDYYEIMIPLVINRFPPNPTQSYYIWTTFDMYGLGCDVGSKLANVQGVQSDFVFLDFGQPYQNAQGILGTILYDLTFKSTNEIASSVEAFGHGFYNCTSDDTITIAIGTNSSGGLAIDVIAYPHRVAWANLIIEVNRRIALYPGMPDRVFAVGGNNIEPGFNPDYIPRHWLDGYNSVTGRRLLYVIASADGCPENYPPTEPETGYYPPYNCNNNWTQEDVYYVTWGAPYSWPMPEIYNTQGANSNQWYRIASYSRLSHNKQMTFLGEMTQLAACQQLREQEPGVPHCVGTDNDPTTGFTQFYNRINSDPYRRISNNMKWSTDMKWYYGTP